MAIKAGQILHAMNRSVVDRIQTAGAGNLNIPTEKIRELGNYQAVATVRDIPDLSFNLDVLDVDTEIEALLSGVNFADLGDEAYGDPNAATPAAAAVYDLATNQPVDIVSPFKSRQGNFDIVRSVAIPHLTLETAAYRYGLRENAGETFTLRGDSIYYSPGSIQVQEDTGDGATTGFAFTAYDPRDAATPTGTAVTAILYREQGEDIYALNVAVDGERQVPGDDYTERADGSGIDFATAPAAGAEVRIVFGFDPAQLPDGVDSYPQSVHQGLSVKPAAIRGKDINLWVAVVANNVAPTWADFHRWSDVQSFNCDWRVTIEDDFEFGNPRAVARDYTDNPEVTGSVEVRHRSPEAMFEKLQEITGVPGDQIIGPQSSVTVHLLLQLHNPDGHGTTARDVGSVLKSLYVPDARFILPGYEGRVQQKLNQTMNFESDGGVLRIFKGSPTDTQFVAADAAVVIV